MTRIPVAASLREARASPAGRRLQLPSDICAIFSCRASPV